MQPLAENARYSRGAATAQSLVIAGVLPEPAVEFPRRFESYGRLREVLYHACRTIEPIWDM